MDYEKLMSQLYSLKENSQSFLTDDADPIWQDDIDALDEVMDIIADYTKVTEQLSGMIQKYEHPKTVIIRDMGVYQCPDCGTIVYHGSEHCRRCGRRLGWMPGSGRNKSRTGSGGKKKRERKSTSGSAV